MVDADGGGAALIVADLVMAEVTGVGQLALAKTKRAAAFGETATNVAINGLGACFRRVFRGDE